MDGKKHEETKHYMKTTKSKEQATYKATNALTKKDLDKMLYKLKKYYNELINDKSNKVTSIEQIKAKQDEYNAKIKEAEEDLDLDPYKFVGSATLSPIETLPTKDTKDQIAAKIEILKQRKMVLIAKYKTEQEYTNTINHMVNCSRETLDSVNSKVLEINEKLENIELSKRNLELNEEEHKKKRQNLKSILLHLKEENIKVGELIIVQDNTIENLVGGLEHKQHVVDKMRSDSDIKQQKLIKGAKQRKESLLKDIKQTDILKKSIKEKENYNIKLILGMDIIKKYFIDIKESEGQYKGTENLLKSEEYKTFQGEKFIVVDNDNNIVNMVTSSNIREDTKLTKITLNNIKEKFLSLDMNYEQLFEFYSKLTNKTMFYHNNMMHFNLKQIRLESKKDKYSLKVKEILQKNYHNFHSLVKNNTKFRTFMDNYGDLKHNEKSKVNEIEVSTPSHFNDFYQKCEKVSNQIKIFFEFTINNFSNVINEIKDEELQSQLKKQINSMKGFLTGQLDKIKYITKDVYMKEVFDDLVKISKRIEKEKISNPEWFEEAKKGSKEIPLYNSKSIKTLTKLEDIRDFINSNKENFDLIKIQFEKQYYFIFTDTEDLIKIMINLKKVIRDTDRKVHRYTRSLTGGASSDNNQETGASSNLSTTNHNHIDQRSSKKGLVYNSSNFHKQAEDDDDSFEIKKDEIDKPYKTAFAFKRKTAESTSQSTDRHIGNTANAVNQRIIDKFYMPYIKKKYYQIALNENIGMIKKNTRQSATDNFNLNKKKIELKKLSNDLIIYNNPNINIDTISQNTYNTVVKYIITSQLEMGRTPKDRFSGDDNKGRKTSQGFHTSPSRQNVVRHKSMYTNTLRKSNNI